jgi:very-short-patch-repair endonuclease
MNGGTASAFNRRGSPNKEYRNSIYEYDFAWLKEKIDVEIDGGTHKTEKVKKIDSRKDEFSRQDVRSNK